LRLEDLKKKNRKMMSFSFANHLRELPLVRGGGWLLRNPTRSNELRTSPLDSCLPTNATSTATTQ
jgi:hypothetical protein